MRAKCEELILLIHDYFPVCIALQETMLGNCEAPRIRDYFFYRTDHDEERGNHGGCALLIRNDIAHLPLNLRTPLQAVAVQIKLSKTYAVCSLYLTPNERISRRDLSDLCQQLPQPFLILGDLNGRHYMWGDTIANSKGDLLLSFIEDENLGILNTGEPTHFHVQTGTLSRIDLSLCSPSCLLDFSWQVDGDRHGSDHFPIIVKTSDPAPLSRSPCWCLERANWPLFQELSYVDITADDLPSVDDAVHLLTVIYHMAGLKAIPRTSSLFQRKPVP